MLLMPFIPLLCAWIYNTILTPGWKSDTFCIVWGEANARADALAAKMHLRLTLTSSEMFYTVSLLQKATVCTWRLKQYDWPTVFQMWLQQHGVWLLVKGGGTYGFFSHLADLNSKRSECSVSFVISWGWRYTLDTHCKQNDFCCRTK